MKMVLPKGVPTLRSFATGNMTRVDNVFCSSTLLSSYIRCEARPELRPPKTDHFPVIQEIDINMPVVAHQPWPLFRKVDWGAFQEDLEKRLEVLEAPDHYRTDAIQATVVATVKMSKPSPYAKRWFTDVLRELKKSWIKLERLAFAQRFAPEHPVHGEAREAKTTYTKAIAAAKVSHWVQWLEQISDQDVWDAHRFLSAEPSD
ncbi:hypothetical protein B0H19DRAFT_848864, partial [Mycena capillaripes]